MGMGLRRRFGRRRNRIGIGRRRRFRFGRRSRRRGPGNLYYLCCMSVGKKDKSYEKDIQELQQQQTTIMQTQQQQQQTSGQQQPPVGQEQNNSLPQQQTIYQQPAGQQQQQINATSVPGPVAHGTNPEVNTEHVKELQEVQMELLNKIMRKQAKEKDPEVLQRLFNEQNILLQQMSQLQTAGYAYSQPLPAPAAPPVVQPQPVPMET